MAFVRLAVSSIAFLPWLRPRRLTPELRWRCLVWGGVQFGLMYVLYIAAYRDLSAAGVAVMTVLTPLYVALLVSARERRLRRGLLAAAALAVVGAAVVAWRGEGGGWAWRGALLVQGSNLCFAAGQLAFRRLAGPRGKGSGAAAVPPEATLTAWMYAGATLLTGTLVAMFGERSGAAPLAEPAPLLTILYLGLLPTAIGFHLWNKGATRAGSGTLAVANNLKVPLGVLAAWLVFGETAARARTALGLVLILLALGVARETGTGGEEPPRRPAVAG